MAEKVPTVAQLFPPFQRDALVLAARSRDWRAIDAATDELVRLGLCRPRRDNVLPSVAERARDKGARGAG